MKFLGKIDWHLTVFVILEIGLLIVASLLWLAGSRAIAFYFLIMFVIPMILATIIIYFSESEYRSLGYEFFAKRQGTIAGLGIIISKEDKVLLNRQQQYPWQGMWIITGGYENPALDEDEPRKTAIRRTIKLLNDLAQIDVSNLAKADRYLAKTRIGLDIFEECMLQFNHAPTEDHLYEVLKSDDTRFSEHDLDVSHSNDLRWWKADEIEKELDEIPPHMRDIILCLLHKKKRPDFWEFIEMDKKI